MSPTGCLEVLGVEEQPKIHMVGDPPLSVNLGRPTACNMCHGVRYNLS